VKTLRDKVVVVTGAGDGIGRALALAAAAQGARLALCDVDEAGLKGTGSQAADADVLTARVDVAEQVEVERFADAVRARFGRVDMLVNNAGVSLSETIAQMKRADFEWLMRINFWGVVNGCSAFLPDLVTRPDAHIVNVSSVFGLVGVPTQSAYNASKFAVRGYTEALGEELRGTTVHVTCVVPGGVRTSIVRRGRHYTSARGPTTMERLDEEFARVARLLPEDAAQIILRAVLRDAPRVLVGADAHLIDVLHRLFPTRAQRILRGVLDAGSMLNARLSPKAPASISRS